jgi:hypothetical protein
MRVEHGRVIDALDRVEEFLVRNGAVLGTAIGSAPHQHLSEIRARLRVKLTEQDARTRELEETVANRRVLQDQLLRDHLRPIAAVAQSLLPVIGDLGALRVPKGVRGTQAFLTAAYGMADAATRHEAALVAAGLPRDFIAQLVAAADGLRTASSGRGQIMSARVGTTRSIEDEARIARRGLRMLDALVRAAAKGDKSLLAQWRSVRRVTSSSRPTATVTIPAGSETPGSENAASETSAPSGGDDASAGTLPIAA